MGIGCLQQVRLITESRVELPAPVPSRVEMEPDKQSDGEKARAKEWLLTPRKDGDLHAWGFGHSLVHLANPNKRGVPSRVGAKAVNQSRSCHPTDGHGEAGGVELW